VSTPAVPDRRAGRQAGFTYVAVLILLAVLSAGLASVGTLWHTQTQREREEELLFIGEQFSAALRNYTLRTPAGARRLPNTLEELLEDRRQPTPLRHLRRIFVDPMTRHSEWGLLRQPDGGIRAVYSLSSGRPFRTEGLPDGFAGAVTYSDWKFTGDEGAAVAAPAGPVTGVQAVAATPAANPGSFGDTSPVAGPFPTPSTEASQAPEPPAVNRRAERCEVQRSEDLRACAAIRDSGGTSADIGACTASASSRFFACVGGRTPPPLRVSSK
jgi:type II secretory pathway pseudopilin PulG